MNEPNGTEPGKLSMDVPNQISVMYLPILTYSLKITQKIVKTPNPAAIVNQRSSWGWIEELLLRQYIGGWTTELNSFHEGIQANL